MYIIVVVTLYINECCSCFHPVYCSCGHRVCCVDVSKASDKVSQILDIWRASLGVVSLHVFQNVMACEAFTREACMIDALGE